MRRAILFAVLFCFAGCESKTGEAIVLDKQYIAAATEETKSQPRVLDHPQWILEVQMTADLRRVDVQVDQSQFDKIKAGDRLRVTYHQGKYTGTIWGAEIN